MHVEETLILVKPDGVARNLTGEIIRRIEAKGSNARNYAGASGGNETRNDGGACRFGAGN